MAKTKRPRQLGDNWHRQPQKLLRNNAYSMGKNFTGEVDLFTQPAYIDELQGATNREKISPNVNRLQLLINALITKPRQFGEVELLDNVDSRGVTTKTIVLKNYSLLAKWLETKPEKVRSLLLMLGGFKYPEITTDKNKRQIIVEYVSHFRVKWVYGNHVAEKYGYQEHPTESGQIEKALRVGTIDANYIYNEPPDEIHIEITSPELLKALIGEAGGYSHTSNEIFKALADLDPTPTKILLWTGTYRTMPSIDLKKLCKSIGLEGHLKKQGAKSTHLLIKKALDRLVEINHFDGYDYDETTQRYTWRQSSKFFRLNE